MIRRLIRETVNSGSVEGHRLQQYGQIIIEEASPLPQPCEPATDEVVIEVELRRIEHLKADVDD